MSRSLDDHFASLARVAKDLNSISDQVTDRLRAIEERLRTLGLGVEVELRSPPLSFEDDGEGDVSDTTTVMALESVLGLQPGGVDQRQFRERSATETVLGYAKLAGTWRLVVRTYYCVWARLREDLSECSETPLIRSLQSERPLLDASRDLRLAAAEQVDELLVRIQEAAQDRIDRLQRSVANDPTDPEAKPAGPSSIVARAAKQRRIPRTRSAR